MRVCCRKKTGRKEEMRWNRGEYRENIFGRSQGLVIDNQEISIIK